MKSQKTQKGGLLDSLDEKVVLVKKCGARMGFQNILQTLWGKGTYDTTQDTMFLLFAKAIQHNFRPNIQTWKFSAFQLISAFFCCSNLRTFFYFQPNLSYVTLISSRFSAFLSIFSDFDKRSFSCLNITKCAYLVSGIQNFDLVLVNLGEGVGCSILKMKKGVSVKRVGQSWGFRPHSTQS